MIHHVAPLSPPRALLARLATVGFQLLSACFEVGKIRSCAIWEGFASSPGLLGLLCPPSISLGGYKVGTWQ